MDQIKKLLPKCQNIKSLYLSEASSDSSYELLLSSVIDNCPRLESIAFNPSFISKETLRLFGQLLGHKLKQLGLHMERLGGLKEEKELILSLCPNLKSLCCADYLWLDISCNEFAKLEQMKFVVDLCSDEGVTAFNIFADKYHKKIKDITVSLLCDELPIFSELMTNFSVFPNLTSLRIEILNPRSLDQWLQVLNHVLVKSSDKLVNLKKLTLKFTKTIIIPDLDEELDSYFDLAKFLVNFKTLEEFYFKSFVDYRYIITSSVDTIISLINLKTFAIDCQDIDHKFCSILPKLMPNLKTFKTNRISEECLPYLSSLKLLTRIAIYSIRLDESLVVELVKSCPQIKRIYLLSCEMKRSKETNEELKTLIESRPKLWIEMEEIEDWGTDKVEEPE